MLNNNITFGLFLTLFFYYIGMILSKKIKLSLFNPLIIATILLISFLSIFHIDFYDYEYGAKYVSYLLNMATVSLALPLYRELNHLKRNFLAITTGIIIGVISSFVTILIMCKFFNLEFKEFVTLLPKSITTAIGMPMSEDLGGYPQITAVSIVITGLLGNIICSFVFKFLKIKNPVSRGLALGSASHAMGTSKAMELGELEGAISSLSLAFSGILTVLFSQFFIGFY